MRRLFFVLAAVLFPVLVCLAQEVSGNPSLLEIKEYLAKYPKGPLADKYADLLALRHAQTLGPDSSEEMYLLGLSTARSIGAKAQIEAIWKDVLQKKESGLQTVMNMTSSHVSFRYGVTLSYVNSAFMGIEFRRGHQSKRWHYCLGLDMGVDGVFNVPPIRSSCFILSPSFAITYRVPSWKSHIKAGLCLETPVRISRDDGSRLSWRALTPEFALEYGFTPFKYLTIAIFTRATPFPYYLQKEYYEESTVDYSMLKPYLDERIRFGVILYLNVS